MIVIPTRAWREITETICAQRAGVERVAYLDGVRLEGIGVVTTVVFPDATERPTHFEVRAEAMSEAGRHLRTFDLRRLAQVHTHPDEWVGHSPHDNEYAVSQREGMISIVIPHHARCAPGLPDCGVHMREPERWRQLRHDEVREVLQLVPSSLDFQRG